MPRYPYQYEGHFMAAGSKHSVALLKDEVLNEAKITRYWFG